MKFTEGLPNCFTMSLFFILILEQYSDVSHFSLSPFLILEQYSDVGHFSFFPLLDNRTIIWCWSLFLLPSSWYWNNILMLVTFLSLLFLKLEQYSDVGHFSFSPLLDTGTIFWCWSLVLLSSSWNWNNILMLVTFPSPLFDTRTIFWCWSLFFSSSWYQYNILMLVTFPSPLLLITQFCSFSNCKLEVQSKLGLQKLAQLGYLNVHSSDLLILNVGIFFCFFKQTTLFTE